MQTGVAAAPIADSVATAPSGMRAPENASASPPQAAMILGFANRRANARASKRCAPPLPASSMRGV